MTSASFDLQEKRPSLIPTAEVGKSDKIKGPFITTEISARVFIEQHQFYLLTSSGKNHHLVFFPPPELFRRFSDVLILQLGSLSHILRASINRRHL